MTISSSAGKPLSRIQQEFNRRMKALERARAEHEREREELDQQLEFCIRELMPLIEELKRADRDLVFLSAEARDTLKLTARRRHWFGDLISGKASDLLSDPVGLSDEDLERLEALVAELGPSIMDEEEQAVGEDEFDALRGMMEQMARQAGMDLDLSDLDRNGDPLETQRILMDRIAAATQGAEGAPTRGPQPGKRKPTKAALERERLQQELEAAKKKDFKSLYKQLAKVLHPDLEPDPVLKDHKEAWMKRLTAAHANGDLRDMLEIEMEWLGEEAGNLANASEAKLKVYSMMLNEQLEELKVRTQMLAMEPEYAPMDRFRDPFSGFMPRPAWIKRELAEERARLLGMLEALRSDDARKRKTIHAWADAHARECQPRGR